MGAPLDPDLVIVSYNNDASPEYQEEKSRAPRSALVRAILRVLYRSDYFLLFQRTVANAALRLRLRPGAPEPPTVPRVSLDDHIRNLLAFQEETARRGARAVYVNMPVNHAFLEQAPDRRHFYNPAYPQALLELCRQNNLPVVDADGELTRAPQPDVFLPGHHFHPSARGHRLLAEHIAPVLMPLIAERMTLRPKIQPGATLIETPAGPIEGAPADPARAEPPPKPADMPEWRRMVRIGYSTLTPLHALLGETLQKTPAAAEARLSFQFLPFLHGKDQDEACRKGLVDLTFSCEVPAMIHLDCHRDLAVLGSAGELGHIALLVNGTSPIRRAAQLKGKTVAVADGASARLLLDQWLATAGLEPDRDVRIRMLKGDGREALEAMAMGAADAAVLWDPWLTEYAQGRSLRVLEHAPFWSLILVSQAYAEARPENVPDILRALRLALDWARANPAPASLFVTRASGLSLDTVRAVLAKNRFLQPEPPTAFSLEPDLIRRLRECRAFAIRNKLAAPDTPLVFLGPPAPISQPRAAGP
jgi:sulfonate transport system substrate-binding protein